MRVAEIMVRRVHTLSTGQTLREVAQQLSRHDISGGPVVDESGAIVGYLTRTDIIDAIARSDEALSLRVEEVMSREIHAISPDASLDDALKIMVFEGVHHLLVRVGESEPQGLLSSLDIFQALVKTPR